MIYLKIRRKYKNANFLFISIFILFLPVKTYSQLDPAYFMGVHIGVGPSFALGSFSKYSATPNSLGKNIVGLNVNADAEMFFKNKYSLSFGLEGITCLLKNNSLGNFIKSKRSNTVDPLYGEDSVGIAIISGMSVGISRLFRLGDFILEPKIRLSFGIIHYDLTFDYPVQDSLGSGIQTYTYELKDCVYATLIPELNLKYIFKKKWKLDVMFNVGISYNRYAPKFTILESYSSVNYPFSNGYSKHPFFTIKDNMSFLNIHAGFTLYLKKKYMRS